MNNLEHWDAQRAQQMGAEDEKDFAQREVKGKAVGATSVWSSEWSGGFAGLL